MKLATSSQQPRQRDDRDTVILLHGLLGRGRNLGMLQRALSPFFRTITVDLRSHGHSSHGVMTYPSMVQDVLETLDGLEIPKATFVGHSMGGKVAMALALMAPERVTKLCVADIAPVITSHGSKDLIDTLSELTLPDLNNRSEIRNFLVPHCGTKEVADLVGQNIIPGSPAKWEIGLNEISASIHDIESWPDNLLACQWKGPALFIKGEHSPYIQPSNYDLIHKLFPRAEIEIVPGTNHWLHFEKPAVFNQIVLDFLERSFTANDSKRAV